MNQLRGMIVLVVAMLAGALPAVAAGSAVGFRPENS